MSCWWFRSFISIVSQELGWSGLLADNMHHVFHCYSLPALKRDSAEAEPLSSTLALERQGDDEHEKTGSG